MIQDNLPRYQTTADGSTDSFTTPFPLMDPMALEVYINSSLIPVADYTVNLSTSTVTFDTTPEADSIITIIRSLPINWIVPINSILDKDTLDGVLSVIIAKMQTLQEQLSRAPKTNPYDEDTGEDLSEDFIEKLKDALDSLAQAEVIYAQIQAAGSQALSDISTERASAISTINTNASNKVTEFNSNASTKTTAFNSNANDVTDTFNANATAKTTAFNNNATTKQAAVDASASAAATSATNASNSATAASNSAANALATETRINNTLSSYVTYTDWGSGVI